MDEETLNRAVTVTLFDEERYEGDWMPEKLTEAIAWLQKYLERVPEECREAASIEIESQSGYEGDHYPSIEISYEHPPTDAEKEVRLIEERQKIDAREVSEREMYERLKVKFGE